MNDYFIMMNSPKGDALFVISDNSDGEATLFPSEEAARDCAENHVYCQAFGYEIFARGMGC